MDIPQEKALSQVVWKLGNCSGKDVDMTPDRPSPYSTPEEKKTYKIKSAIARKVCQDCVVPEACYVYSREMAAPPIFAASLSVNEKSALESVRRSPASLSIFIAEQVVFLETKRSADKADRSVT